ncbi:MAG TPA: M14 metallopeptidase family protein [Gemmatimonadaceae bacterium]|nr:M14 metallopeptidase family protein [Gemmatimonadaceae bacterium]
MPLHRPSGAPPLLAFALLAFALCALPCARAGAQARPKRPATSAKSPVATADVHITTPREEFGANFGDDYFLANYKQIAAYWHKLQTQSARIKVVEIGKTAEGRPHLMAIVTSPENHKNLARYKEISSRLAHAEGLTDDQARAMAKEGKAVVWIDGGLHATEVLGAQQLGEMVYQMVSRTDDETMRFLNDVVTLFVHANPDGNDLVADWYMRNPVPAQRSMSALPRLYQKYIGHDDNRDFFASTQAETKNENRVLYHEWFPQLLYNHHQSGPEGTIVYSPPFRDPYNYNLDPAMLLGLESLGAAMHLRLAIEGKPGATQRSGGPYDGWWNGGIRNTATFHNTIAVLTEMIGSPTPMRVPLIAEKQIPSGDLAMPVAPQEWHFRQSVDYSISLDRAVLDYASRFRENLLFNIYKMGRHSIERGSRDTWTANPRRDAEIAAKMGVGPGPAGGSPGSGGRATTAIAERDMTLWAAQHAPGLRDPRAFIIPSDQPDFPTATKFINALLETGITVNRASHAFDAGGKHYPAGSFVVFAVQAFRPHVMDMFEPQVHPDVFPYSGAPPTPPYDNAGWTLAFQMGVQFDRVLDLVTGPFDRIGPWDVPMPPGKVTISDGTTGFVTTNRVNNSFVALNRLLKENEDVVRLATPFAVNGRSFPAGAFYVRSKGGTRGKLDRMAAELGVNFDGTSKPPPADARKLRTMRVGLWDQYGGSMPSGWTRWLLEQFEFPFERVFPPALDAGNLDQKYDVLIFVTGAIPGAAGGRRGGGGGGEMPEDLAGIPAEYRSQVGRVTAEKTLPRIREFLEKGGTVIAIGTSAANLATQLKLPVENPLLENGAPLPRTRYYVPGSLLTARVDTSHPLGSGMAEHTDMFFDDSPVFKLAANAESMGVRRVAWYDSRTPLHSGWAWGQSNLENGVAALEARVGKGRALLFGPEILMRGQPHGTFKFLFNGIHMADTK